MKNNATMMNTVLKLGGILLAVRIVIQFLFTQQMGVEALFSNSALPLIELGVTFIAMIYGGYNFRDNNGLRITLQEGFLLMLGIYGLASLGTIIWQMIWINIDPSILAAAPNPEVYSAANIFNNFFGSLVMGSVFALAFSYFLSRRKAKISGKI